jgi:hypothetical protein
MLGIRAEREKALLSTNRALGVGAERHWLPFVGDYRTFLMNAGVGFELVERFVS